MARVKPFISAMVYRVKGLRITSIHVASLIDLNGKLIIKAINFTNTIQGYQYLKEQINHIPLNQITIAMEATGHYWLSLFSFLIDDGYNVCVYNPYCHT